jgi:hypothetical protein
MSEGFTPGLLAENLRAETGAEVAIRASINNGSGMRANHSPFFHRQTRNAMTRAGIEPAAYGLKALPNVGSRDACLREVA